MTLEPVDWLIIVAYFAATLLVGLRFSARAGQNLTEYFLSGRSLPWWIAGTSMVATTFAADTPLAVTGLIAKHGLAGNWFWWAFALGGMFTVFVYARLWRRAEVFTDVELIELRYGGKPASWLRGMRAVYLALVVNPLIIGWVAGAILTVLSATVLADPVASDAESGAVAAAESTTDEAIPAAGSHDLRDFVVLLVLMGTVGVYCTLAGMWGVALTDFLQFFLAMGGCIALAVAAVGHVGGIDALKQQVVANYAGGAQAFQFIPDFSASDPWLPLSSFAVMLLVQWWATWYPGAEPGGGGYIVQRMASCRDERHAVGATLWYQVAHYCVRPWPWVLVAFAALAMYPELRQMDKPDVGYAWVMRDVAPPGLRGLLVVTFLAAFMSTISTQMNWGASYLVRDVYQRFLAPDATDQQLTRASRIASLLILVAGSAAAWVLRHHSVDKVWTLLLALGAGTGAVFMLRWFWWRINAWTEIASMLGALAFSVIVATYETQIESAWFGGRDALNDQTRMLLIAACTIVTWLLVTWLTPPESMEVLQRFYRKVRPAPYAWGPVAKALPDVDCDRDLGASILAAVVSAVMVYSTLMAVGVAILDGPAAAAAPGATAVGSAIATWWLTRRLLRASA